MGIKETEREKMRYLTLIAGAVSVPLAFSITANHFDKSATPELPYTLAGTDFIVGFAWLVPTLLIFVSLVLFITKEK